MQFSSIWPIDRTLIDATTPGQSGPGSDGNEGVLRIPHSSSIVGTSPSDCLVSYPEHSLRGHTPLQRSSWCILQPQPTGPQDIHWGGLTHCREAVSVFYGPSWQGHSTLIWVEVVLLCRDVVGVFYNPSQPKGQKCFLFSFFYFVNQRRFLCEWNSNLFITYFYLWLSAI